ncbi:MAG: M1 family aminopeptidase [Deltaproteobacteria bacterium]|nr:M1 family aminopeptidase [Deltaproteobacteria bacterium]
MRIARGLIAFLFIVVGAGVAGLAFAALLAVHGQNLPLLRAAVGVVGRAVAGQRTTDLTLRVDLQPSAGRLDGQAVLRVVADGAARQRFYYLLNDGLTVRAARYDGGGGPVALRTLRLGPLLVLDLPEALAAGQEGVVTIDYAGTPRRGGLTDTGPIVDADDVSLSPADFWYPSDVQAPFAIHAEVRLPAHLTLAHNGAAAAPVREGTTTRVRVDNVRPVAGLALIAGRYKSQTLERDGRAYRVLLPPDSGFDAARLLAQMATAYEDLTGHYRASGFTSSTLVVPRRLARAFNDGSGLIAIPPRYFRDGRYGYETIAHELAHDWWGATVSEQWLTPGSGGEWIVEGFAEYSAWRAVGEHFGEAALSRTLARSAFDPDDTGVLAAMSVIDNGLDPQARATIYAKGGYVTYMLAQALGGPEAFDAAAVAFLDAYRYRSAGDAELEKVFTEHSQNDLAPFFAAWVRSKAALDLALDPQDGNAAVRNLRDAPPPAGLALWKLPAGEKLETAVGQSAPLGEGQRLIVDPLAATADMIRSNNVLPRRDPPQRVIGSSGGALLVVSGEPVGWEPATLRVIDPANGKALHTWMIDRGLASEPVWSADGTRVLAVESARSGEPSLVALNVADGGRRTLGRDLIAAGDADGTLIARGGKLIRQRERGGSQVLIEHSGARIVALLPAPRAGAIAYALARDADLELRLLEPGAVTSRILFTAPVGGLRWRWAPDASRLYAILPGDWDWQLWELPTDGSEPRRLVHEAARIADLAVAADGHRVALVAQADLDDTYDRAEIFVVDGSDFRRYDLGGTRGAQSVAWLDENSLLLVTRDARDPALPRDTALQKLSLGDGSLADF